MMGCLEGDVPLASPFQEMQVPAQLLRTVPVGAASLPCETSAVPRIGGLHSSSAATELTWRPPLSCPLQPTKHPCDLPATSLSLSQTVWALLAALISMQRRFFTPRHVPSASTGSASPPQKRCSL